MEQLRKQMEQEELARQRKPARRHAAPGFLCFRGLPGILAPLN